MRRRRTLLILAVVAVLFSATTPHATAAWQCEGRVCGTTPWFCCCESDTAAKDDNCDTPGSAAGDAACSTECGCTMTIADGGDEPAAVVPSTALQVSPVILTAIPESLLPALPQLPVYSVEARGPPLSSVTLDQPSLRAPPAA